MAPPTHLALLGLCGAVEAAVAVAVQVEECLQDVQHARHLRENQRAAARRLEPLQQSRQLLPPPTVTKYISKILI